MVREAGEGEAAKAEAGDGGQGLGPAVGLGGGGRGGGAQADEDGVARLHADEGAVGVVDGAVDQAGDEGAGQHDEVGVLGRDDLPQVRPEAVGCRGPFLTEGAVVGGSAAVRVLVGRGVRLGKAFGRCHSGLKGGRGLLRMKGEVGWLACRTLVD